MPSALEDNIAQRLREIALNVLATQFPNARKRKNGDVGNQSEMARAIGIDQGYLSQILRGRKAGGTKYYLGLLKLEPRGTIEAVFGAEAWTEIKKAVLLEPDILKELASALESLANKRYVAAENAALGGGGRPFTGATDGAASGTGATGETPRALKSSRLSESSGKSDSVRPAAGGPRKRRH